MTGEHRRVQNPFPPGEEQEKLSRARSSRCGTSKNPELVRRTKKGKVILSTGEQNVQIVESERSRCIRNPDSVGLSFLQRA